MSVLYSHQKNDRRVGLIGVGLLGIAIAERLLAAEGGKADFELIGFDAVSENVATFTSFGGVAAKSNSEVAEKCDRLILCLPDALAVSTVVTEIRSALRPNQTIIDTTTSGPDHVRATADTLATISVDYLDATVSGSSQQMRAHAATLLVGGSKESFAACEDIFSALSKKVFHLGPTGSGATMKLITNLAIGLNRAVLAESLALGEKCGFDSSLIVDVLRNTPAHSAAMDTKGQKMAAANYSPQARLRQHHKDVGLILDLAREANAKVPLSELHSDLLSQLIALGRGDEDNSVIVEAFRNEN